MDPEAGPIGRFFDGEATSEIGLRSGAGEDFWAAFQPDLSVLDDDIARGNKQLAGLPPDAQGIAILALA
jgi:cytochrome c-type biogenesis protein CcmF